LARIQSRGARFISRGDNSGTDLMEKAYWKELGKQPEGKLYISSGLGMGEVLTMAAELQAYTLTDRATYAAYQSKTGLAVLAEGDPRMFNPYGIIAVNPAKYKDINYAGAMKLVEWITSAAGRKKISDFKIGGLQMFFPLP
jgi:tungstate transport system substrate-binding protein